jgi:prepilin-type N-terminal cleavage/methylation domain-containing protein
MLNLQKKRSDYQKISLYFFNFKNMQTRKPHPNPLLSGEGIRQNSCPLQNSCPPRVRGKASEASKGEFGLCHSDKLALPQWGGMSANADRGELQNQWKCKNTIKIKSWDLKTKSSVILTKTKFSSRKKWWRPHLTSPCKGEGQDQNSLTFLYQEWKNEISPIYKGGLRGGCGSAFTLSSAFTLVELIVVITILAILWTISFIALQGFAADARDVKRLNDIKNLLSKIEIEHTKWVPYSELINWTEDKWWRTNTGLRILWQSGQISHQWPANFKILREDREKFKDPLGGDYIFWYAEWWSETSRYSFIQWATISEKNNNKAVVVWNYYQTDPENDEEWIIFWEDGKALVSGWNYEIAPNWVLVWWLETDWGFTRQNLTLHQDWTSYTIMDRNLWATEIYDWIEKSAVRWNYYQWWNNYWFPNSGDVEDSTIQIANANSYWPWNYYFSSTFVKCADNNNCDSNYDWANPQNDNLWWDKTNTNVSRQWPCPSWRHIPTTLEWDWLVKTRFTFKWWNCAVNVSSCSWSSYWIESEVLASFKFDLKLPFAGYRNRYDSLVYYQGSGGYYWSSSSRSVGASRLYLSSSDVTPQGNNYRAIGYSVRCFKN